MCCVYGKKVVTLQRIMDSKTLIYRVWSWVKFHLTAWSTGGEGVHSPYLFEWVRMVMSDKHRYYSWASIEECRQSMLKDDRVLDFVDYGVGGKLNGDKTVAGENVGKDGKIEKRRVCDIAKGSLTKRKYAEMLYRLVNWLGEHERIGVKRKRGDVGDEAGLVIVELGTSLGVTTAYLALPDSRNKVVTFEGCASVAAVARENWHRLGVKNIECIVGEIDRAVLLRELDRVDVAFVDANHTCASAREYFNVLADKVHAKSVIVMDDIHYSADMECAWREICNDERVTSTMDLYQMGLVFFDPHYWHRNYRMRL